MATLSAVKPELDNGIWEEIEVLIEEHERLIDAAREETSQSNSGDSMTNFFETDDWPAEDTKEYKHPAKEGIFMDKSIDKTVTKAKKTRKQTHLSQASKIVAKPFLLKQNIQKTSSSPPPLLLAATFDTAPSSIFDDEERDRDGYSTTSGDTENNETMMALTPTQEFSRMSVPDIATIMEEQQVYRESINQTEVQREQEDIDECLLRIHCSDGESAATEIRNEIRDDTLEWLEEEVDHAEIVAELALEIGSDDGSTHIISLVNAIGNNVAAVAAKPNLTAATEEETSTAATSTSQKESEEHGSSPRVQDESVNAAAAEEETPIIAITPIIAGPTLQKEAEEGISSTLVQEKAVDISAAEETPTVAMPMPQKEVEEEFPSSPVENEHIGVDVAILLEKDEEPPPLATEKTIRMQVENVVTDPSVEKADESLLLPLVEEKSFDLVSEDLAFTIGDEEEEFPITAPPPSPVRNPVWAREEQQQLTGPSIETDQLPPVPSQEKFSVSQLLLFEDHPQERATGSIDSDEVHYCVDQETEDPMEAPPALPNIKNPVGGNGPVSKLLLFEDHPEERVAIPIDLEKVHDHIEPIELPKHVNSSDNVAEDPPDSSNTASASMSEVQLYLNRSTPDRLDAHGYFGHLKLIVLVTMACTLGAIGYWSNPCLSFTRNKIQAGLVEGSLPKAAPALEEDSAKRHRKAKKKNRRSRDIDLDEFHSVLW